MSNEAQIFPSLSPVYAHLLFCRGLVPECRSRGSRWRMPISPGPHHKPPILPKLPTIYNLFMQNKPNFQDAKMNVSIFSQMAYKNFIPLAGQKNKPKQTQFQRLKNAPAPLRNRYAAREIFKKLLIYTLFYSIIVLIYALYIEVYLSVGYGEGL